MYEWIKNRQGCVPTHSDLVHAVLISSDSMGIHPADKGKVNVFVSRRNNRGTTTMLRCSFHEGIRVFTKACQESRTILFTICLKGVVEKYFFFLKRGQSRLKKARKKSDTLLPDPRRCRSDGHQVPAIHHLSRLHMQEMPTEARDRYCQWLAKWAFSAGRDGTS